MTTTPRSPNLIKGAFIELSHRFIGAVPNIIGFQYNPESVERSFSDGSQPKGDDESTTDEALVMRRGGDPVESITLKLFIDATDDLESGQFVAETFGVADRLAALEMLLYPEAETSMGGLLGDVAGALGGAAGAAGLAGLFGAEPLNRSRVPVVLFIWGPGRIVPVRLMNFSITEQQFSTTLYPTRAEVSVTLRVVRAEAFSDTTSPSDAIAKVAYAFTKKQKEALPAMNTFGRPDAILNMLPF